MSSNPPPGDRDERADDRPTAATGEHDQPRQATDEPTAATWGRFGLLEELGQGGFGRVHRAWDPDLRREVALKLINLGGLGPDDVASVLREGQLLARIRHPHVVTVFSAQSIDRSVGLAMELVRGHTLSTVIARQGVMSALEAAVIGLQIADALAAVHHLGVVHQDVKPSNVMRESGGRIVLMDFGAGRDLGDGREQERIIGTPQYMAPEVLAGERATNAADLYSLAVLLFYLVSGKHPVEGTTFAQLRSAHARGTRRSLAELRPDLPTTFVEIVEQSLDKDGSRRHPSAASLRAALAEFARPTQDSHGEQYGTPAIPSTRDKTRVFIGRFALGASALVSLCGLMGFVTTTVFNVTLARTGSYAETSLAEYFGWGARSLVAPVFWVTAFIIVLNVFVLISRTLSHAVPALGQTRKGLTETTTRVFASGILANPNTLAQALCMMGVGALLVIGWSFRPLLAALTSNVNDSPASALTPLATSPYDSHVSYRLAMYLLILGLAAGTLAVEKHARLTRTPIQAMSYTGLIGVLLVALFLTSAPWRLLWSNTFPIVTVDNQRCFLIGEDVRTLLITCPANNPPRNIVRDRADSRVAAAGALGKLFDAFEAPASVP